MDITGRIIAVLPERSGTSQRNGTEWRCASYVLQTQEQYPKSMCFEVFGSDRISSFNIQMGETLTVSFDIDAHEYQGRWFNSIRAFRVSRDVAQPDATAPIAADPIAGAPFGASPAPAATPDFGQGNDGSDLPF